MILYGFEGVGTIAEVIDFHVHPIPKIISREELVKEVGRARVDKAVLLALDIDEYYLDGEYSSMSFLQECVQLNSLNCLKCLEDARKILKTCYTSNEYVGDLVRSNPERFIGVGSVNPSKNMSYVKEKLKEIEKLGLIGIKLIPTLQFFNPLREKNKLEAIFEFCEREGKFIIFHTGCDPSIWEEPSFSENANPSLLEYYVKKFKNVQVVLAHMGSYSLKYPGIWFDEALQLGRKYSNVWFDISAVPYILMEKKYVEKIDRDIGWSKVLFGSDYPVAGGYGLASLIELVKTKSLLSEKNLESVLGLNALKLLGL